jgi:hypothetical protein
VKRVVAACALAAPLVAVNASSFDPYYAVSRFFETAARSDSAGFNDTLAQGAVMKLGTDSWPVNMKRAALIQSSCRVEAMRSCNPEHVEIRWDCPSLREEGAPNDVEQYATVELQDGKIRQIDLSTGPSICTTVVR